ncbi:hypothetical protein R3I94_000916 [Phoxinus phoxinus]|uniref:Uncharacterized protein n=1 Tax=Phoxinus phoxinus TaxID=58324 RepID=A0AAN9HI74_9TELE
MSLSNCSVFVRDQRTGAKGEKRHLLPSLLLQRKHLVPSVPPEKRGKKERSESLHPKCQWGQRGCQLPRTTRCWKTASLNEGCAFRKPS